MSRGIFVDSSAWIAFFDPRDQHHSEALTFLGGAAAAQLPLSTSDYVLSETVTRLRMSASHRIGLRAWELLESGSLASLIEIDPDCRSRALVRFRKCHDQCFSLTDCTSFAIMDDLGLLEALTFDADFRRAGFRTIPGPRYPGPLLKPGRRRRVQSSGGTQRAL